MDKLDSSPETVMTEWEIVTDYGDTGLSVGDLIKPTILGVTTEQFYVIGIDGTGESQTIRLLARYCVDWEGVNAQNPAMGIRDADTEETAGALAFRADYTASNANEYAESDIKDYVDAYANWLDEYLTLEDVETSDTANAQSITGVKGRLMWGTDSSGEVQNVLSINATGTSSITGTTIVYGTETARLNYWLGSPNADFTDGAWLVYYADESYVDEDDVEIDNAYGLRPVIKVLASKIS